MKCFMHCIGWLLYGAFLLAIIFTPAHAREGWQGRPLVCDPAQMDSTQELDSCRAWIMAVKQPNSRSTCCGEGDAYIADGVEVDADGNTVAIITQDYPSGTFDDGEGDTYSTKSVPLGTKVIIPESKINHAWDDGGNPSGHGIVFMTPDLKIVLCYFGPTLASVRGPRFAAK